MKFINRCRYIVYWLRFIINMISNRYVCKPFTQTHDRFRSNAVVCVIENKQVDMYQIEILYTWTKFFNV